MGWGRLGAPGFASNARARGAVGAAPVGAGHHGPQQLAVAGDQLHRADGHRTGGWGASAKGFLGGNEGGGWGRVGGVRRWVGWGTWASLLLVFGGLKMVGLG